MLNSAGAHSFSKQDRSSFSDSLIIWEVNPDSFKPFCPVFINKFAQATLFDSTVSNSIYLMGDLSHTM